MFLRKSDKKKRDSSGEYVSRSNSTHDLVRDALLLNQITDETRQNKFRKQANESKKAGNAVKAWKQAEYKANNISNSPKPEQPDNNVHNLLLMIPPKEVRELKKEEREYKKQINLDRPYLNGGNSPRQNKTKLSPIVERETSGMKLK